MKVMKEKNAKFSRKIKLGAMPFSQREYLVEGRVYNGGIKWEFVYMDMDQIETDNGRTYSYHDGFRMYKSFESMVKDIKRNIRRDGVINAVLVIEKPEDLYDAIAPSRRQLAHLRKEVAASINRTAV